MPRPDQRKLKQVLSGWQIFFIVISAVIGSGCFIDYGVAAKTAGSAGLLIGVGVVGVIAICAMEGLSEMIQRFPTVNPIVELITEFVDQDVALCVGIVYWLAQSSVFALQFIVAAEYLDYYDDNSTSGGWLVAKVILFYLVAPSVVIAFNCLDIRVFGLIESICGLLKMVMLLVVIFMLYFIAGARTDTAAENAQYFSPAVISKLNGSSVPGSAVCAVISRIAFSFVGMETFALTSFEAKDIVDLRLPSKFMAYAVFWSYFMLAIATGLCVDWQNAQDVAELNSDPRLSTNPAIPYSALTVAARAVGKESLGRAMNAIFIFYALSAANSTLYATSRMLYGIAHTRSSNNTWLVTKLVSVRENGVPCNAVLVSAASFCLWLPFTQVKASGTVTDLLYWFYVAGDLCIFFMWAAISFAYIRYWFAFRQYRHHTDINESAHPHFGRRRREKQFSTLLDWAQPVPAFIGLFGSILIVYVFPTAVLWGQRSVTAHQFFENYTAPLLVLVLLLGRKLYVWWCNKRREGRMFKKTFKEWLHEVKDEQWILEAEETLTVFLKPSQQNTYVLTEASPAQGAGGTTAVHQRRSHSANGEV